MLKFYLLLVGAVHLAKYLMALKGVWISVTQHPLEYCLHKMNEKLASFIYLMKPYRWLAWLAHVRLKLLFGGYSGVSHLREGKCDGHDEKVTHPQYFWLTDGTVFFPILSSLRLCHSLA